MSRDTACRLVKECATRKVFTVAEIANALVQHESNIREWLYEMDHQGIARITGYTHRSMLPGGPTKGKSMVQVWEWLL